MKLWLITGSGRGVGKTHLAQRLSAILPHAVYAKLGCHPPKTQKPQNYFTDPQELLNHLAQLTDCQHAVVESNQLALRNLGDIRIHIDAPPQHPSPRPDAHQLRTQAHILISGRPDTTTFRDLLTQKLGPTPLIDPLYKLLESQNSFLAGQIPT